MIAQKLRQDIKRVQAWLDILDQFGEGTDTYSERISIMPMDNQLACTCNACRAKGNTSSNATPAVSDFVMRLAKEFPRPLFAYWLHPVEHENAQTLQH